MLASDLLSMRYSEQVEVSVANCPAAGAGQKSREERELSACCCLRLSPASGSMPPCSLYYQVPMASAQALHMGKGLRCMATAFSFTQTTTPATVLVIDY